MDDQTRIAHFESMRRTVGMKNSRTPRNKKLYGTHKDLQRQCDKQLRRHDFDARMAASDIRRQQRLMEKKQELLKKQQRQCIRNSGETHKVLSESLESHGLAESMSTSHMRRVPAKATDAEVARAIRKMQMPRYMMDKLQMQTYTSRVTQDS